ncbi:hypothetical protein RA210_U30123 [Rubrivivax sp. A210]|nr:hypothetical protein RA210_U30123 [Rubrivivax sp. A210]
MRRDPGASTAVESASQGPTAAAGAAAACRLTRRALRLRRVRAARNRQGRAPLTGVRDSQAADPCRGGETGAHTCCSAGE